MAATAEHVASPTPARQAGAPATPSARRSLRILFITWNYYPAPAGGAERQARLQAEELVRRGHSVTVTCQRAAGVKSGEIGGVRVRRLWRVGRRPFRRISYLVSLVLFFARNARRFDLVHVHLANLQADAVVPIARVLRRPVYVKVACGGSEGEVTRFAGVARVTRWVGLRGATRVQALSDEIEGELLEVGVRRERIRRIPNGLDGRAFRRPSDEARICLREQLDLPARGVIVLYVGRFARYKGLDDLLDVWTSRSRAEAATLVLVGTADTDKPIGTLAARPDIVVRDWTNSIATYLGAADVFVYPSYADGMSNAVMEAMSAGLAVAASRSGATAEIIEDGTDGLLFDAGNRAQIAKALDALIRSSSLRRRLGQGAAETSRRFAIESVVDEIERVYFGMVASR
jgi:glycosyltransferase involved in cell wall biosynthesis